MNATISSEVDSMGVEYVLIPPTCSVLLPPVLSLEETWKPSTRKSLSYRPNFGFNAGWAMAKGCFSHQSRLKTLRNRGSHPRAAKLHGISPARPGKSGYRYDTVF